MYRLCLMLGLIGLEASHDIVACDTKPVVYDVALVFLLSVIQINGLSDF